MKQLILDYSKWRCGLNGGYALGKGFTLMNNKEGFMCCLGQFSLQLDENLNPKDLNGTAYPFQIDKDIPLLNQQALNCSYPREHTELSRKAVEINDTTSTTPDEKIDSLRALFKEYDFDIVVINKPESNENTNS